MTWCLLMMTMRRRSDFASRFKRRLKSISSLANKSKLNPPKFRKARLSQKMNEPAPHRIVRLTTFGRGYPLAPIIVTRQSNDRSSGHASTACDLVRHRPEQTVTRLGIGVQENQPVARCGRRATIARAADLVDGLEDDRCARS